MITASKAEKKKKEKKKKEQYPQLMQHKRSEMVVLFTGLNAGVVVYESAEGFARLGEYSDGDWVDADDREEWEPLKEAIVLQNE